MSYVRLDSLSHDDGVDMDGSSVKLMSHHVTMPTQGRAIIAAIMNSPLRHRKLSHLIPYLIPFLYSRE
jgi:hypothetical protein